MQFKTQRRSFPWLKCELSFTSTFFVYVYINIYIYIYICIDSVLVLITNGKNDLKISLHSLVRQSVFGLGWVWYLWGTLPFSEGMVGDLIY